VLERAQMTNSGFASTTEVNRLINVRRRLLHLRIAKAVPYHYSTDYAFNTVAGTIPYALPADFLWCQDLYAAEDVDHYRPIRNLTGWQRNVYRAPQGAYSLVLRYTPTPVDLSADADTVDGIIGYDEWIVASAARCLLLKERDDVSQITGELRELEQDIIESISFRDQGQPQMITEVEMATDWPYPYRQAINGYQLRGGFVDVFQLTPAWPA
jgi:hypothetical protein